jgi:sirohydrochlorin cobaltochelatase
MCVLQPPPRNGAESGSDADPGPVPDSRPKVPERRAWALLVLGHGSDRGPEAARPIRALAGELRGRGAFSEVRVGFWKEAPFLHEALGQFEAREVAIVPIFTSVGYYTEHVIPRELALEDPSRRPPGMNVRLCRPVGTHPGMAEVVLERAQSEGEPGFALVIVGHGTPKHPESGRVTRELADALRDRWRHGPVAAAFLDEEPGVERVVREQPGPGAVVVPFFISEGWHAGVTLPASLSVQGARGRLGKKAIRYTPPVGTHPRLADFVLDLAGV